MDNCNPTPEDLAADFRDRFPNGFKDPRTELKTIFQKNGIECSSLDELVHTAASQQATNANNGGIDVQLNFLLNTCELTPQDILNALEIKE